MPSTQPIAANPQELASEINRLKGKCRVSWKSSVLAFGGGFAAVWTALEPLDLLGLDPNAGIGLRVLLYVGIITAAAILTTLVEGGRLLYIHQRIAKAAFALSPITVVLTEPLGPLKNDDSSREFESNLLGNVPLCEEKHRPVYELAGCAQDDASDVLRIYRAASVLSVLRNLRLIGYNSQDDSVSSVGNLATYFVRLLSLHYTDNVPLIRGWNDHGIMSALAQRPRSIIRLIEEGRAEALHPSIPTPVRRHKVSIVILKGKCNGDDVYLMQKSPTWGTEYCGLSYCSAQRVDCYWFIGGIFEPNKDEDSTACAKREAYEEVGIEPTDVVSVTQLGEPLTVQELSRRVGLSTETEYTIFKLDVQLVGETKTRLLSREFTFETPGGNVRSNRWHTWDEILDNDRLKRDAGELVDRLNALNLANYVPSFNEPISQVTP